MVISLIPGRFFAELNRFGRAPLDAGETLFAMVQPNGSVRLQFDVSRGTDLLADPAGIAFFIDPETPVHRRNMGKGEPVEPGKQQVLPQGTLFDRPFFSFSNRSGNHPDLFPRLIDPPDPLLLRSGPAPGDVVGRHYDLEAGGKIQSP